MEKKKGLSLQMILTIAGLALVYLLAFLLDRIPGVPIMLTTVLRKGAIYSLVAVSMNLLNGFTGLFSLGQAGFMLVGAYAFAAINISSGIRSTVYQYYDPLLNFSLTETLQGALGNTAGTVLGVFISLLLAGLHLAFAFPFVHKLLLLFNLWNTRLLVGTTAASFLAFAVLYTLVYRITSNAYYHIVSGGGER